MGLNLVAVSSLPDIRIDVSGAKQLDLESVTDHNQKCQRSNKNIQGITNHSRLYGYDE